MTGFGSIGTVLPEALYAGSFGNTPNHTVIVDRLNLQGKSEIFQDNREQVKAALTTSSPLFATGTNYTATSGSIPVLLPTVVDDKLYDLTIRDTPLASGAIPRVTNQGLYADYIKRTALATAKWEGEQSTATPTIATYTRAASPIKFLRSFGEITGPMLVSSNVWKNAMTLEVEAHQRAIKELEENTIINGTPTTNDTDGSVTDAQAFSGFISLVTTNYEDKNDAELTITDIREGIVKIRQAYGHPNLCVTDYNSFDVLKGEMQNLLRYPAPTANVSFGIEAIQFEGLPVLVDLFMPTTDNAREFHIWDTQTEQNVQMRMLQDTTYAELAKSTDSTKFMIKEYLTMIMVNEKWCHRIYDLS